MGFQNCEDSKKANDTEKPFADAEKMRPPICIRTTSQGQEKLCCAKQAAGNCDY